MFGVELLVEVDDLLDVVARAEEDGRALVDLLRHDVEDRHASGGRHAARHLHDERHRVTLVQQTELLTSDVRKQLT